MGREQEQELATTSLEIEYLHRKSLCEMLIGGDDISNDIITLGSCFSMFVDIHAIFHFTLFSTSRWLAEIWQLSRRSATGELEVEVNFQKM